MESINFILVTYISDIEYLSKKQACSNKEKRIDSYHPTSDSLWAATEKPNNVEGGLRYSTWVFRSMLKGHTDCIRSNNTKINRIIFKNTEH